MKTKEFKFNVKGNGQFPFDMLRYDRCFPQAPLDAQSIPLRSVDDRLIGLVSERMPTLLRWASFGWQVCTVVAVDAAGHEKTVVSHD